jgi:hypothetical protein
MYVDIYACKHLCRHVRTYIRTYSYVCIMCIATYIHSAPLLCSPAQCVNLWRLRSVIVTYPFQMSVGPPSSLTEVSGSFPQALHQNPAIVCYIRPCPQSSTSLPVHESHHIVSRCNIVCVTASALHINNSLYALLRKNRCGESTISLLRLRHFFCNVV